MLAALSSLASALSVIFDLQSLQVRDPWPDLLRPGLNGDRPRGIQGRVRDSIVQSHRSGDFDFAGAPLQVPGTDELDVNRVGNTEGNRELR